MDWRVSVIVALVALTFSETLLLIHWLGLERSPLILLTMLPVLMIKAALIAWIDVSVMKD